MTTPETCPVCHESLPEQLQARYVSHAGHVTCANADCSAAVDDLLASEPVSDPEDDARFEAERAAETR